MQFLRVAASALLLIGAAGVAVAQSVPPIGRWTSASGNVLVVNDDATCAYLASTLRVQGNCYWQGAGQTDSILVIEYQATAQSPLQRMDVSIHWVNRVRILVLGEPFQRG